MDRQGQWDEPKGQQRMDVQSTLTHQTELNAANTGRDSSTAPKSVFSTERFAIQYVVNGAENIGHWGGVIVAICTSHGIRLEGAISNPTPSCPPVGWSSGWLLGAWPVPAGSLPSTAASACTPVAARSSWVYGRGSDLGRRLPLVGN